MSLGALFDPKSPEGHSPWDYGNDILETLRDIKELLEPDSDKPVSRQRRPFVIPLDAGGFGTVDILLPPGIAWDLLTYAFQFSGGVPSAGCFVAFYRDVADGTGLILARTVGAVGTPVTDNFNAEGHYIPEQSKMVVQVIGGPANGTFAGNVTLKGMMNGEPRNTPLSGEFS